MAAVLRIPDDDGKAMTPAQAGRALAALAPPLSDVQVEQAARILAAVTAERMNSDPRARTPQAEAARRRSA